MSKHVPRSTWGAAVAPRVASAYIRGPDADRILAGSGWLFGSGFGRLGPASPGAIPTPKRAAKPGDRASARGYSTDEGILSRKPGRPAKDRVQERIRIYSAAAPIIQARGLRRTTVEEIARAALLTRGGIYHYFSSKEEMALYGLAPEALAEACHGAAPELKRELSRMGGPDPEKLVDLYAERALHMLEFVRPALDVAVELGRDHLREPLSRGVREDADGLVSALRPLLSDPADAEEMAESICSRIFWAAFQDRPEESLRRGLRAVFRQFGY